MTIEELRDKIETTDYQILELIRKRTELAAEIGKLKKEEGLPIRVPEVEEKVVARYRASAVFNSLDPDEMEKLARALIEMAIRSEE